MTRVGIALWSVAAAALVSCQRPAGNGDLDARAVDAAAPACGNGILDPGEVCDDGNTAGGDGCSADCKSDETCGNGIVDTSVGERCDDGNTLGGDGCSADCTSDETCGNGIVDTDKGETCDDGNTLPDDLCSPTCQVDVLCGNGFVDGSAGEQCDDGSALPTAGCNLNCTFSKCGDHIINSAAGEKCDDGNLSDNDNCTHLCTVSRCGDGILDTQTEECDDGNLANGDGCQNSCKLGPGNDTSGFAVDVSAGGTFNVNLTKAHDDISESCSDPGAGKDVFYKFTLGKEEVVYADTFGSTFDTTLALFPGPCNARGAELLCQDDACMTNKTQIAGDLVAGTYCLVLDQNSPGSAAGPAVLTVRHGGRSGTAIAFGDNVLVSGDTTMGDTNQMASTCASTGSATDHGYFFTTCPNEAVEVQADTCQPPNYDTVLYVLSATNLGSDQACNDDAQDLGSGSAGTGSGFTFAQCGDSSYVDATFGGSGAAADLHWIIVDGWSGTGSGSAIITSEGPYTLTYSIDVR